MRGLRLRRIMLWSSLITAASALQPACPGLAGGLAPDCSELPCPSSPTCAAAAPPAECGAVAAMVVATAAHWTTRLRAWLSEQPHATTVVLTMAESSYARGFASWFNMRAGSPHALPVFVALTSDTCATVRQLGLRHLCFVGAEAVQPAVQMVSSWLAAVSGPGQSVPTPDLMTRLMFSLAKFVGAHAALSTNATVLLSEFDVYWQRDAVADLEADRYQGYDVLVSGHIKQPHFRLERGELNSGIFLARPTAAWKSALRGAAALRGGALGHHGGLPNGPPAPGRREAGKKRRKSVHPSVLPPPSLRSGSRRRWTASSGTTPRRSSQRASSRRTSAASSFPECLSPHRRRLRPGPASSGTNTRTTRRRQCGCAQTR